MGLAVTGSAIGLMRRTPRRRGLDRQIHAVGVHTLSSPSHCLQTVKNERILSPARSACSASVVSESGGTAARFTHYLAGCRRSSIESVPVRKRYFGKGRVRPCLFPLLGVGLECMWCFLCFQGCCRGASEDDDLSSERRRLQNKAHADILEVADKDIMATVADLIAATAWLGPRCEVTLEPQTLLYRSAPGPFISTRYTSRTAPVPNKGTLYPSSVETSQKVPCLIRSRKATRRPTLRRRQHHLCMPIIEHIPRLIPPGTWRRPRPAPRQRKPW
jgi:hypothetical protein